MSRAQPSSDMTWYFAKQQLEIISSHGTDVSLIYGSQPQWRRSLFRQSVLPPTRINHLLSAQPRYANAGIEGPAHTRYANTGMSAPAVAHVTVARSSQLNSSTARWLPSRVATGHGLKPCYFGAACLLDSYLHPASCSLYHYCLSDFLLCVKWMHLTSHESLGSQHTCRASIH